VGVIHDAPIRNLGDDFDPAVRKAEKKQQGCFKLDLERLKKRR